MKNKNAYTCPVLMQITAWIWSIRHEVFWDDGHVYQRHRNEKGDVWGSELSCMFPRWMIFMEFRISGLFGRKVIFAIPIAMLLLAGCTSQYALFNVQNQQTKALADQCKACRAVAKKTENDSYKQSAAEMKAVHKSEQARIKKMCDAPIGETVELPAVTPQAGQTVVPTTDSDGSFSIPGEKGLFKVEHECFIDAKGRKICK